MKLKADEPFVHQAFIKSIKDHGYEIYETEIKTSSLSLIPVRNTTLRVATGAFRNSPVQIPEHIMAS